MARFLIFFRKLRFAHNKKVKIAVIYGEYDGRIHHDDYIYE